MNIYKICISTLLISFAGYTAHAQDSQNDFEYENIVVFGDSLTDTGNLNALDSSVPERLSNGPLAVEFLAHAFGLELTPSFHLTSTPPFGNNFSVAGAKAQDDDQDETTPDINLPTQINAYLAANGGVATNDTLYVIFIGGNDLRGARKIITNTISSQDYYKSWKLGKQVRRFIDRSVKSEKLQLLKLVKAGAKNILVVNSPDIGLIPETSIIASKLREEISSNRSQRIAKKLPRTISWLSSYYNFRLARSIRKIERKTDTDILEFDLASYLKDQIDNSELFGHNFTDVPCIFVFTQSQSINPSCTDFPVASGFLFWDEVHPTTQAHQGVGVALVQSLLESEL